MTPYVTHLILKTIVSSGNLKCIHKVADFSPAKLWAEVFNQMDTSQKFSICPFLNCNTYLVMSFLKAVFGPLMSEMKTEKPILSLSECLQLESDQTPQCICELIIRACATFKSHKADAVDLKKFLLKDYTKQPFRNSGITEELHAKVHKMLVEKIGGEFNEAFVLNLLKIKNESLDSFANAEADAYPPKNSAFKTVETNFSARLPVSENPLLSNISQNTFFMRGNDVHKIKGVSEEANDLNHIKLAPLFASTRKNQSSSQMIKCFLAYHKIDGNASKLINECEEIEHKTKHVDQVKFVASMAHKIVQFLHENPLLLSSSTSQAVLVDIFNLVFDYSESSFGKPIVAAFVWDSFATRGIDASFIVNGLDLKGGISIYDLSVFPAIPHNVRLDIFISNQMEFSFYRNFAYMYFSYYLQLVSHSVEEVPFKDYFPSIIKKYFGDQALILTSAMECK